MPTGKFSLKHNYKDMKQISNIREENGKLKRLNSNKNRVYLKFEVACFCLINGVVRMNFNCSLESS